MILVVNADDAGIDPARNRGILRAARQGVVRSASLLAGFEAAAEFAGEARSVEGLGIGLHLNFSEGAPLARGHRSLVGPDGRFLGKRELWRRGRTGGIEPREARREIEAQLERCAALGIEPDHVDGHNHAHLFPGIAEALAELLPDGVWVRMVPGAGPDPSELPEDLYAGLESRLAGLGALSSRALALGWSRFRRAGRFEGLALPAGYAAGHLISLLRSIAEPPDQIVELMTHPGEASEGSAAFSRSLDRPRELAALTDPCLFGFIEEWSIDLRSFGELP